MFKFCRKLVVYTTLMSFGLGTLAPYWPAYAMEEDVRREPSSSPKRLRSGSSPTNRGSSSGSSPEEQSDAPIPLAQTPEKLTSALSSIPGSRKPPSDDGATGGGSGTPPQEIVVYTGDTVIPNPYNTGTIYNSSGTSVDKRSSSLKQNGGYSVMRASSSRKRETGEKAPLIRKDRALEDPVIRDKLFEASQELTRALSGSINGDEEGYGSLKNAVHLQNLANNSQKKVLYAGAADEGALEGGSYKIQSVEDLPEETKKGLQAFLHHVKDRVIDGKPTGWQILGWALGTAIGIGVGNAMPPVYINSLDDLNGLFHGQLYGTTSLATGLIVITAVFFGLDGISRNSVILGNLLGPDTSAFSVPKSTSYKTGYGTMKGLHYLGGGLSGLLPLYFLYKVEKAKIDDGSLPSLQTMIFFGCLGPPLALDTLFNNSSRLSIPAEKSLYRRFADQILDKQTLPLRQQYLRQFKEIKWLIYGLDEYEMGDLYEGVFDNGLKRTAKTADHPIEDLKMEDALRVINILKRFHSANQEEAMPEFKEEAKKTWSSRFAWTEVILGSPGRSIALLYSISQLLEGINIMGPANMALSYIFGAVAGSIAQGLMEKAGVDDTAYKFSHGKKVPRATSQPYLRTAIEIFNYVVVAACITLPYALLELDATNGWNLAPRIISLIFPILGYALKKAMTFNNSYGDIVTGVNMALSPLYKTVGYKKDKLLRMTRELRGLFKTLRGDILIEVDRLLKGKKVSSESEENGFRSGSSSSDENV